MSKALLKWSPAVPIKAADKIISSKAKEKNQLGFTPSYESEPREHIRLLLSNEYMRIWFHERAVYEKDTYTREKIIKEESKIKRRFVQRMMTYRKPNKNQFIDEMVEKRMVSASRTNQVPKKPNYEKMKYKPDCSKVQMNKKTHSLSKKKEDTITGNKTVGNEQTDKHSKNEKVFEADIECVCCCKESK